MKKHTKNPSPANPQTAQLWIVGGGIAGMSVAAFAIRDGKVPASHIHILEETGMPGGSLDGGAAPNAPAPQTWVTRGGRMLTDETYLCLWDLFEGIPSLEDPTVSVREECRQFNARVQTHAQARLIDAQHVIADAEKLGLSFDPALISVGEPQRGYKTAAFAGSSVLAAARLAEDVGDLALAKRFFLHLAEGQDRAGLEALSDLALLLNEPHIALVVAKQAAEKGWILPRAYYPVPDMVPENLSVSRALALAISRRESEFNPDARSHANAMGLMQLLPETAGRMAKGLGVAHETRQLTADPAHNATLGAAYLRRMVDEFGPSVAMVAAGYNAGPGRPRKWVAEFGDPRTGVPLNPECNRRTTRNHVTSNVEAVSAAVHRAPF